MDDDCNEMREAIRTAVTQLIQDDACGECLRGQAVSLEMFVGNIMCLTPSEKKLCIFTSLAVLYSAEDARPLRVRSSGERIRFHYYVPFVGRVCKQAFMKCFGISSPTLARYRLKIRNGWLLGHCD